MDVRYTNHKKAFFKHRKTPTPDPRMLDKTCLIHWIPLNGYTGQNFWYTRQNLRIPDILSGMRGSGVRRSTLHTPEFHLSGIRGLTLYTQKQI